MEKTLLVKEKENSFIISGFFLVSSWFFLQVSFHCSVSHQCPIGLTYWVIVGETHSDIVILYSKYFHQSHSCMHIKERCIAACVNYGSYWKCQIFKLGKQDLFQSLFSFRK